MLKASIIFKKAIAAVVLSKAVASIKFGEFLELLGLTDSANVAAQGVLLNQDYCGAFYFDDDYTGEKRIL
jgi:hypothetical protein